VYGPSPFINSTLFRKKVEEKEVVEGYGPYYGDSMVYTEESVKAEKEA